MREPGRATVPASAEARCTGAVVLCADDYALTEGVSRAALELAALERVSAVSALVTTHHWAAHATALKPLRERLAVGLHINLTHGRPLGPMPALAPQGRFPAKDLLILTALARRIDVGEITCEVSRQIDRFSEEMGALPDFLDGHCHVHALPGIRGAVFAAIGRSFPFSNVTVRDPGDRVPAILARGTAIPKALAISALSRGFARAAGEAGLTTNRGFSGVSSRDAAVPFQTELERFFVRTGPRHLIMCHPGYVDTELEGVDPCHKRRHQELEDMKGSTWLNARLARPRRLHNAPTDLWPVPQDGGAG